MKILAASLLLIGLVVYPGYSFVVHPSPETENLIVNDITAIRGNVQPPANNMKNIVSTFFLYLIFITVLSDWLLIMIDSYS